MPYQFRASLKRSPDALILYMDSDYDIGHGIVSLMIATNAMGFILVVACTHVLEDRFGCVRTYLLSQVPIRIANVTLIRKPPFSVVTISFFFIGTGVAINLALRAMCSVRNWRAARHPFECSMGSYVMVVLSLR